MSGLGICSIAFQEMRTGGAAPAAGFGGERAEAAPSVNPAAFNPRRRGRGQVERQGLRQFLERLQFDAEGAAASVRHGAAEEAGGPI